MTDEKSKFEALVNSSCDQMTGCEDPSVCYIISLMSFLGSHAFGKVFGSILVSLDSSVFELTLTIWSSMALFVPVQLF